VHWELRCARWADIELAMAEWQFTAGKTGKPHIVPLAAQAVDILRGLYPLTGNGEFVFPSASQRELPMSDMAMWMTVRGLGLDSASLYDFQQMARTILNKPLKSPPDCIAHQMSHPVGITTEHIYSPALRDPDRRLAERKAMMQTWADWLDSLRNGRDAETWRLEPPEVARHRVQQYITPIKNLICEQKANRRTP